MDPATIAQIIAAVAQKAQEAKEKADFSDWRDDVSAKLNEILQKTDLILNELRAFRVQIEVNLDLRFRSYYLAGLVAAISDLGNVLAGVPNGTPLDDETAERIYTHVSNLRYLMKQSLAYGFASVPAALAGYSVLIPAMQLANVPKGEFEDTRRSLWELVFEPALNPALNGSFAWALDYATNESAEMMSRLNEALRPATLLVWNDWLDGHYGFDTTPTGAIIIHPYKTIAVVCVYSGNPVEPDSIVATPVERRVVKDQSVPDADWGNNMISFANVQPSFILGGKTQYYIGLVDSVRQEFLNRYVTYSRTMVEDDRRALGLQAFIAQVRKMTTP